MGRKKKLPEDYAKEHEEEFEVSSAVMAVFVVDILS